MRYIISNGMVVGMVQLGKKPTISDVRRADRKLAEDVTQLDHK